MLAQAFGKAFQQDLGKHGAGTNLSRKSLRWDWMLEANLNRKANGLALEGPSVGIYVPLLEFNPYQKAQNNRPNRSSLMRIQLVHRGLLQEDSS